LQKRGEWVGGSRVEKTPTSKIRTDQAPTHPAELQTPKNNCGAALAPPPSTAC